MHSTQTLKVTKNLRAEMARRGITQKQVAAGLGLSPAQMSARMAGHPVFDIDELFGISEAFGIDLADLIEGPRIDGRAA